MPRLWTSYCKTNWIWPRRRLIHNYVSYSKQRIKVASSSGEWFRIVFGVHIWTFTIYLNHSWSIFITKHIDVSCNADNIPPHVGGNYNDEVIKQSFHWFTNKVMKSSADKYYLFVNSNENVSMKKVILMLKVQNIWETTEG